MTPPVLENRQSGSLKATTILIIPRTTITRLLIIAIVIITTITIIITTITIKAPSSAFPVWEAWWFANVRAGPRAAPTGLGAVALSCLCPCCAQDVAVGTVEHRIGRRSPGGFLSQGIAA